MRQEQDRPDEGPRCGECVAQLDHCHGTLIIHAEGSAECTSSECTMPFADRHLWVLDCAALLPECACAAEYQGALTA